MPNSPENLAVVTQSTTAITFSWDESSNNGGSLVTDFSVYWNAGSGTTYTLKVASTGVSPTQTTITSITPGTVYSFTVTATNAAGPSLQSTPLSSYAASLPTAPGTPFRIGTTTAT